MKIINRYATHDYTIGERFEAGIKLTGAEVKSAKGGHVSLKGAFVRIIGNEAFLINAHIEPYPFAALKEYDPRRTRKLLVGKKQIISLNSKISGEGLTLVPLSMYATHGLVKLEVGVAKGKKLYDHRTEIKKRTQKRELEREYRGKVR